MAVEVWWEIKEVHVIALCCIIDEKFWVWVEVWVIRPGHNRSGWVLSHCSPEDSNYSIIWNCFIREKSVAMIIIYVLNVQMRINFIKPFFNSLLVQFNQSFKPLLVFQIQLIFFKFIFILLFLQFFRKVKSSLIMESQVVKVSQLISTFNLLFTTHQNQLQNN